MRRYYDLLKTPLGTTCFHKGLRASPEYQRCYSSLDVGIAHSKVEQSESLVACCVPSGIRQKGSVLNVGQTHSNYIQ
jgi:hypothetical protein